MAEKIEDTAARIAKHIYCELADMFYKLGGCAPTPVPAPIPIPPLPPIPPIPPIPVPTPRPPVGPLIFDVTNRATVVTAAEISAAIAAVQTQVALDFIPAWGSPAPTTYRLVFLDEDPSVPGALGYHDLEGDVPVSYILCKTAKDDGVSVSSVLSHEVLEMIVDPITTRVIMEDAVGDGKTFTLYMAEVCDAVEQDLYTINGVQVSNFVLPAWFDPENKTGPFDFRKKLTKALQLLPGGSYIAFLQGNSPTGWNQKQARGRPK
jgi:hypothetical protein